MPLEDRRCIDCGELVSAPHCRSREVVIEVTLPRALMLEFMERYNQMVGMIDGEWGPGCTGPEQALLKSIRNATGIK